MSWSLMVNSSSRILSNHEFFSTISQYHLALRHTTYSHAHKLKCNQ